MFGGPSRPNVPGGAFGPVAFILCLVGLLMVYLAGGDEDPGPSAARPADSRPAAGPAAVEVDRVVDGDTAKVFYRGESQYVRYIGIDTPEAESPDQPEGECYARQATDFNEDMLAGGEARLRFGPELRDRFGRLLAYVYVSDVMLNEELLRRGLAETLTIPPNDAESERFEQLEKEARQAGLGLWAACP